MKEKLLFVICALVCATGFISPPVALCIGLAFGLIFIHPYAKPSRKASKFLLQASVVGLGFGMNLQQIIRTGKLSFVYTFAGISGALVLGYILGRVLEVPGKSSFLISTGTAICGGSAIAAVAPITEASDEQIAVSLGTVFMLNSVALLLFPPLGCWLHLSQAQFGLWSALAIHDTSSVVGAAAKYGTLALAIATTVKLARALWIVPVSLGTAMFRKSSAKIQWPWFIAFFCLAAALNTYLPAASAYSFLFKLGRIGLTVTLFLIGASVSRQTLKQVGFRPLLQGILLWFVVASISLLLILRGVIHL
ncbi:MAG TPA: putative sulfate exporter family transporter [Candidatus Acidoferrales bacterium]|nr:putative sulfate exporter family transporter [Candidatus Acidoferrales bacterium]